jgi:hypothetical protein
LRIYLNKDVRTMALERIGLDDFSGALWGDADASVGLVRDPQGADGCELSPKK